MEMFPDELKGFALVVGVSALLAYALTQIVRSFLAAKGLMSHRFTNAGLRSLSTIVGGKAGVAAAAVWLPDGKAAGGLLLGLVAGAFCTGIVWIVKRQLLKRLGVGQDTLAKLEALDGTNNADDSRDHLDGSGDSPAPDGDKEP